MDHTTLAIVRQWLNVIFAVLMPLTAYLSFGRGVSFESATAGQRGTPLIEPAGYAFAIWGPIYAGSCLYSPYQASGHRPDDSLTSTIGWWSAFLSVIAWLLAARFQLLWGTVACIVWLAVSLLLVFLSLPRHGDPILAADYWLVSVPLSLFLGWVTIASFANFAAALKESGAFLGSREETWTISLIIASLVALTLIVTSRGNAAYTVAVEWALAAIVVANAKDRGPYPTVVVATMFCAFLALGGLLHARHSHV